MHNGLDAMAQPRLFAQMTFHRDSETRRALRSGCGTQAP